MLIVFWSYVAGVLIGVWRVDASPVARVAVAVLWPVGLLAGLVTVTGLSLIALVLFPWVGAIVAASVAAAFWLWSA